jgi:Arc/MetJ-type ribon-helix-helix transcriptional regulator
MMYSDVVQRTQIYLTAQEAKLLERESERTGASRSELIRRAIRAQYGQLDAEAKLAALRRAAGVWKDRPFTGAEYVDAIRGDLNDRLKALGLD